MKLNNKVYNILKWVVIIVLPTIATLYAHLGPVWGFPMVEQVTLTINEVATGLGVIVGISTLNYNKSK